MMHGSQENVAGKKISTEEKGRKRTMKERPETERPYEKCMAGGAEALTDGELLAVLLRSGTREYTALDLAWELLDKHPVYKGLAGLYHLDRETLKEIPGIGDVKATEILCVLELSKRLAKASLPQENDFSAPEYIAAYYMEQMRHLETERVLLLLLNAKNRLIREIFLSEGAADFAYVSMKKIFQEALRYEAARMVLIHNHPSGSPEPSRADLLLTRQVKEAGEMMGIALLDHIVIGDRRFFSLREEGMM